jgi:hypothetical protein
MNTLACVRTITVVIVRLTLEVRCKVASCDVSYPASHYNIVSVGAALAGITTITCSMGMELFSGPLKTSDNYVEYLQPVR